MGFSVKYANVKFALKLQRINSILQQYSRVMWRAYLLETLKDCIHLHSLYISLISNLLSELYIELFFHFIRIYRISNDTIMPLEYLKLRSFAMRRKKIGHWRYNPRSRKLWTIRLWGGYTRLEQALESIEDATSRRLIPVFCSQTENESAIVREIRDDSWRRVDKL